jgi:hypothetical protein
LGGATVISIGLLGSARAAADYYLTRRAGCEADYYVRELEPAGRWVGPGAAALGLDGAIDEAGERTLRALLDGVGPDGQRSARPVWRADPASRLPARPLLEAIDVRALERGGPATGLFADERLAESYARLSARASRANAGTRLEIGAEQAERLAQAAGLDPHTIYRGPDDADRYADAAARTDRRVDVRRTGLDVTVSAPKSVSLLYAFGDEQVAGQVRAAHATAVEQELGYLNEQAGHGLRGHQGDGVRAARVGSNGLIVAAFEHRVSRAGDPQLHTHLVLPNLVHGKDGAWSVVDSRAVHRHALTASYLYQAVLRSQLTGRLDVAWTARVRGVAEVAGIPRAAPRLLHPPHPDRSRTRPHRPRRRAGRAAGLPGHPVGQGASRRG